MVVKIKIYQKKQEASALLSSLGIKTPLSKIPLVGSLFLIVIITIL